MPVQQGQRQAAGVTVIACQTTMTSGRSYRVSALVMRKDAANTGEDASITSA